MLCCRYRPLDSLEVSPQSVRRRGLRGLLFHQNPGGDKNLFRTALQEEGEAGEQWPRSSSSQTSHVLVFCAPGGGSSGLLSRLRLSCSSVLTFVACVDVCKVSRVPPEVTAEPCPKSGDTTRSTIFSKYPATRTEKNRLCARQRVMSGIGGHALTLMTIMWWWWCYTSWPSQCNSEVSLPFINCFIYYFWQLYTLIAGPVYVKVKNNPRGLFFQ